MLTLNFSSLSRRNALRVGALTPLGLALPALLRAEDAAQFAGGSGPAPRARAVILIYLGGGLSHHDSFDPKPLASEEIRGKYQPIATNVTGTMIGELLPHMSQCMDKVALVRSGAHNNDHHETATNWVLSGRFGTPFGDWPAIGAVAAHQIGFDGNLPPYVAVPRNPSFTWELGKSAFLGGRYESFKAGDPNEDNYSVRDLTLSSEISNESLDRRRSLLDAVDQLHRRIDGNDQIATYDEFHQRAADMILSSEAQSAFAIDEEPTELRDAYGRNTFGQSCLLARRLVERGARFVTVNYGGWDHHSNIFEGLDHKLPELDQGLSTFLRDMETRGCFEETLVAVFGEFGRTPKINNDAGRDHWAPAASLLFAGAGVRGGLLLGETDETGNQVISDPVSPADVAFTILSSLGIDPRAHLYTPDGRPVEILDQGSNIDALFA